MKDEIERLVGENKLSRYVTRQRRAGEDRREDQRDPREGWHVDREELPPPPPLPRNRAPQPEKLTIHMIMGVPTKEDPKRARKARLNSIKEWEIDESVQHVFQDVVVEFKKDDWAKIQRLQTDAFVIRAEIGGYNIERIFVDTGISVDVMFLDYFRRMNLSIEVKPVGTSLFGLTGKTVRVYGKVQLPMVLGEGTWKQIRIVTFMLVDTPSQYNVIMGRPSLSEYASIISTAHLMMKFPVEDGKQRVIRVGEVHGDQQTSMRCYMAVVRSSE